MEAYAGCVPWNQMHGALHIFCEVIQLQQRIPPAASAAGCTALISERVRTPQSSDPASRKDLDPNS